MDPVILRAEVESSSRAIVEGCFARAAAGDESPPIIVCARHKAAAISAGIEHLEANVTASLSQLTARRDAAIAAGRAAEDLDPVFESRAAEVRDAATKKRVALEAEAVSADSALERAIAAVADLKVCARPWLLVPARSNRLSSSQAAESLSDTELADRTPGLLATVVAARAAVAAVPVSPATDCYVGIWPPTATPEALRVGPVKKIFGRILVSPVPVLHVHTLHCSPTCDLRFAVHTHNATCNHKKSARKAVFDAASRGDVHGLQLALADGGSTEEAEPEVCAAVR